VVRAAGDRSVVAVGGDHRLTVSLPDGAVPDQVVQLAVRPENVRLSPATPVTREAGGLAGKISEVTFLGNFLDCYVSLDDGSRVRVQVDAGLTFDLGQPVVLHFEEHSLTVFDL
jgi:hypothetical protein